MYGVEEIGVSVNVLWLGRGIKIWDLRLEGANGGGGKNFCRFWHVLGSNDYGNQEDEKIVGFWDGNQGGGKIRWDRGFIYMEWEERSGLAGEGVSLSWESDWA